MSDRQLRQAERAWSSNPNPESALAFVQAVLKNRPHMTEVLAEAVAGGLGSDPPEPHPVDREFWKGVPQLQIPGDAAPEGKFRALVLRCAIKTRRAEWGGGLELRVQFGFHAGGKPYKAWHGFALEPDRRLGLNKFVRATCPWIMPGGDFIAPDAVGRYCTVRIGKGWDGQVRVLSFGRDGARR